MKYISFGYRCSSASILKRLNWKEESYPFDWMVSRLPIIADCLENDFAYLLGDVSSNYQERKTVTQHYDEDPNANMFICHETVMVNRHYEAFKMHPIHTSRPLTMPHDTYAYPCAYNHHNPNKPDDYAYIGRCIDRLRTLLLSQEEITYLYIHPALTITEYREGEQTLLNEIKIFQSFLQEKYSSSHLCGIIFIPIKTTHPYPITDIMEKVIEEIYNGYKENTKCIINLVYMNKDFVDAGEIFMRNAYIETDSMVDYLRKYDQSKFI